jgi:hypothetical protein
MTKPEDFARRWIGGAHASRVLFVASRNDGLSRARKCTKGGQLRQHATTDFSLYLAVHEELMLSRQQHQHPRRAPQKTVATRENFRSHEHATRLRQGFGVAWGAFAVNPYGARRSVIVSLWKATCSRKRTQPPSFLVVCAALFFSPVAKSSHEL